MICLKDNFNKSSESEIGLQSRCASDYTIKFYDENYALILRYRSKLIFQNLANINVYIKNKMKSD